jgi:hypothetical protein
MLGCHLVETALVTLNGDFICHKKSLPVLPGDLYVDLFSPICYSTKALPVSFQKRNNKSKNNGMLLR